MNRDQILRRHDEITAETDAVIRRGKEIVAKLESGAIKPEDPQVKEVSRLADEQHNKTHTQC